MNARWIRVSRKDPCAVCRKPDWCDYAPEIGLALCMRVESDRPSKNVMGGWLHKIGEPRAYVPTRPIMETRPDFDSLWRRWSDSTEHHHIDGFAMSLGVETDSLKSLGCVWSGQAWAFPMRDSAQRIIGLRLRDESHKWAVKGSKQGLFIPDIEVQQTLYILEGPTDTAAALTLGLYAIGRPSCLGCEEMVKNFVRRTGIKRTVIVTDNDTPGLRGAAKLQGQMPTLNCTYSPPCKDLREFLQRGGTRQLLEASINDLVWAQPC